MPCNKHHICRESHSNNLSPMAMNITSTSKMFDPFGMTAFGDHKQLIPTTINDARIRTPVCPPRQNSRLYQNIGASFYPIEPSTADASMSKTASTPTPVTHPIHHDVNQWLNNSDTLQQMEQTLTGQIEEIHKNLRCLDSITGTPGLDELRSSMLAQLTKLQSILQSILNQRMVMSPTTPACNIIPIRSTANIPKPLSQQPQIFIEKPNSRVALMPVLQQQINNNNISDQQQHLSSRQKLVESNHRLVESCTWYHGKLTWQEADHLLHRMPFGTFLLRNSQSQNCDYALSVKHTDYGPTSIRINFTEGKFRLDSDGFVKMPGFNSIPDLVQFYYTSHHNKKGLIARQTNSVESPITLVKPLHKNPLKLTHLARLAINSILLKSSPTGSDQPHSHHLENKIVLRSTAADLNIPVKLADFLDSYKFIV